MAVADNVIRPMDATRAAEDKMALATPGQLFRWRFMSHRVAVLSLVILVLLYLTIIFAEFVAPYDPARYDVDMTLAPPQRIRFIDDGQFQLRPFVYGYTAELDPNTFATTYEIDPTQKFPIHFFVKGDPYKMWGLLEGNRHLFGVQEGAEGTVFLFGADTMGRDLLSRIIYGGRISLSVGLLGIAISFVIGVVVGGISGYYGGTTDVVIQRMIEFIRSVPTLPLWMALSVALPPTWT
ncbi:MAG: peptide ABC transporter permease, partial [Chloroflexi bacterium]